MEADGVSGVPGVRGSQNSFEPWLVMEYKARMQSAV